MSSYRTAGAPRLWRVSFVGLVAAAVWSVAAVTPRAEAGSIPLQEAWTYDGPQPHGPGAPLVSHLPYNSCGLTSDSVGFEEPGPFTYYQYVADDFALSADAMVRRLVYWGFYNSQVLPTTDETFQINVHELRPSDGLPGDIVFSETVVNPFREWTGRNVISVAGGREYRFEVDLATPFFLQGGETHWLSIYQVGDPLSSFRWECSQVPPPANGQAFKNADFPNWLATTTMTSNTAYELYSIPEPTSCLMLFGGFLVCVVRRRVFR